MYKLAIIASALGFLFISSTDSFAKKGGFAGGMTPGQQMQKYGSKPGYPGASGYAPGHAKKMRGYNTRAYAPRYRVGR